jgi:hypothetical protein
MLTLLRPGRAITTIVPKSFTFGITRVLAINTTPYELGWRQQPITKPCHG